MPHVFPPILPRDSLSKALPRAGAPGARGMRAWGAVCGMRGVGGFLSWKGRWGDVFCIAGVLRSADSDAQGGETRGRPQRWDREWDPSMQRSASVPDRAIGPDGAPRACVDAGEDAEALKHGQRVDRAGLAVPEHACERARRVELEGDGCNPEPREGRVRVAAVHRPPSSTASACAFCDDNCGAPALRSRVASRVPRSAPIRRPAREGEQEQPGRAARAPTGGGWRRL